jgi:hypothetical protein
MSSVARDMPLPEQLERQVNDIQARYQLRLDLLKAAIDEAMKDMPSDGEMMLGTRIGRMKHVEWYVKIPEFVMRQQTWYVRIPEFKLGLQRVVWHMPEPCMKYMKFPWGGGMHIPGVCMREKDWRFHVPEVTVREQKWILGIPEVTMKERHWSFDIPEIIFESSRKRLSQAEEKAEAVGKQSQKLADEMGEEVTGAVRAYLTEAREALVEQFDWPINSLRAALASAPAEAKGEMSRKLAELEEARANALKDIDAQIKGAT